MNASLQSEIKVGGAPLAEVHQFLGRHLDIPADLPKVKQFKGGASNLTYLLKYPNRDLILRCPPPGAKSAGSHDMAREAAILSALKPHVDWVPEVFLSREDKDNPLGAPFFIMAYVDGLILRGDPPADLNMDRDTVANLGRRFLDTLLDLHGVDLDKTGLSRLDKGPGYVARQISGWTRRYNAAKTPDATSFEEVAAWLADHQPEDRPHCLIHNDFRFDNLVLDSNDPGKVLAVLDWELATVGDPLMELGASLAYWVQADDDPIFLSLRRQPSHLDGMPTRAQLVLDYGKRAGLEIPNFDFYEVYGLFRLAGIAQQIYYRYYHGQVRDERFAPFIHAVNYLEKRCLKLIGASQI